MSAPASPAVDATLPPVPLHAGRRRGGRRPAPGGARPPQRSDADGATSALRDLCRAVSEAETSVARGLGLRAGDYRAVKLVLYSQDPLGVSDLSRCLGHSKGTTSELVDRLEARGYVLRESDPLDGRRVVLRAQPLALSEVHESLGRLFGTLTDVARTRDPATLRGIADFLVDAADAVRARGTRADDDRSSGSVPA